MMRPMIYARDGSIPTHGVCWECHTDDDYDPVMGPTRRLCFYCAELQRLNPHPTRPSPFRAPEWR